MSEKCEDGCKSKDLRFLGRSMHLTGSSGQGLLYWSDVSLYRCRMCNYYYHKEMGEVVVSERREE